MLPEDDVEIVRQWAEAKTPAELRDSNRIDVEVGPRSITIDDDPTFIFWG